MIWWKLLFSSMNSFFSALSYSETHTSLLHKMKWYFYLSEVSFPRIHFLSSFSSKHPESRSMLKTYMNIFSCWAVVLDLFENLGWKIILIKSVDLRKIVRRHICAAEAPGHFNQKIKTVARAASGKNRKSCSGSVRYLPEIMKTVLCLSPSANYTAKVSFTLAYDI